jgi:broad specificity polyphosphatase/5'/3'-nucleotidase SurE
MLTKADDSSPFILPWHRTLKSTHPLWDITVVIPNAQTSGTSKAYRIFDKTTATFYNPDSGLTTRSRQSPEDWVLLDGY